MGIFKYFFHCGANASYVTLTDSKERPMPTSTGWGKFKKYQSALVEANIAGAGVFMAPNYVEYAGPVKDCNVTAINTVFLDVDGTMKLAEIKALTPHPHLIVRTSPGKYHVYWLVCDLSTLKFKSVQQALADKYGTDRSVCNPGRLMRMPGTYHQKGEPVMVKIIEIDIDAEPIQYRTLLEQLGVIKKAEQKRELAESSTHVTADSSELRNALAVIPGVDDRETWLKIGMAIHNAMPNEEGFHIWRAWSEQSSKFDPDDQRRSWDSFTAGGGITKATIFKMARDNGWESPTSRTTLPTNDLELVDDFAKRADGILRYDSQSGKWMVFIMPVWVLDEARVVQAARRVVETMMEQAKSEKVEQLMKLLGRFSSMSGLRLLLKDASADPSLTVTAAAFDREPRLLAVKNGVVDLLTSTFRAAQSGELLKCQSPTAYDPYASYPKFLGFLNFITCDRPEYKDYLQRALGYTLFGHTNEQVFFIAYGHSGNGKGTLFRLMGHVLGPFVKAVSPNLLSRAYSGNPNASSPALMALHGPRMFQCGEGEERHRFDTAFIKQLSGSDPLSGRYNHGDQVEFTPVGKLWLSANNLPDVPQQDEAMWRRIRVLPFDATIEYRDGAYETGLQAEAPGVLNWLIEGARKYADHGLGECEAVTKASSRARKSADSVAAWIKANCKLVYGARVQASLAFDDYRKFCRSQDRQTLSVQQFANAMKAKGHTKVGTNAFNAYIGIQLTAP